jgi:hypothetical protein
MKLFKVIMLTGILSFLSGCVGKITLPEINADRVEYNRTDPFGGSKITITGLSITEDTVQCEEYIRVTGYPSFNQSIRVTNYSRQRSQEGGSK